MEPIRLKIKNFFAIAEGEIDFVGFSSAIILGRYDNDPLKSNGAAKSSIFEAICWVIFNETRQNKVDDIIRWTTDEAAVEFEFVFSDHTYKISRARSRVSKESSVSLFTKEGAQWINDSGSTNSETNKKILDLLKIDATIFLNSVYFKQHDISLFATANPSERKEIIKSILKLERWDEYQKQAKNKLRGIKDEIENQLRIMSENNKATILQADNKLQTENTKQELKELNIQQKHTQDKLHDLLALKKENDINNLKTSLKNVNNEITELKTTGKRLQNQFISINNKLDNSNNKYEKYVQLIADIQDDIENLKEQRRNLQEKNCEYEALEAKIVDSKVECARLENTISELESTANKVGVGRCRVCLTDITKDTLPHIHKNRDKLKQQAQNELKQVRKIRDSLDKEYAIRKKNKEKIDECASKFEVCKTELMKARLQKDAAKEECTSIEKESDFLKASINEIAKQIKTLTTDKEAIEAKIADQNLHNIDDQIEENEQHNDRLLAYINKRNMDLGSLIKESEFLAKQVAMADKASEVVSRLSTDKITYEQLTRFFGKEGIQAVFIESVIDELERYANETLAQICNEPMVIKLKTQKKSGDSWQETLEIDVLMNGHPQTFESLGGGERFRISLALRIGLSEVLVKRAGGEIKLLLLDEIDSPLDVYGLNNLFENIIRGLEKRFKILIISHNNRIRERFSSVINVVKTTEGSYIKQEHI